MKLHWLPVRQRIEFKIVALTWKSIHGHAPQYISDLLTQYKPTRELRSASVISLTVPKHQSNYGKRAFATAAPVLWNSLPSKLRETESYELFKKQLKTYLFNGAYSS